MLAALASLTPKAKLQANSNDCERSELHEIACQLKRVLDGDTSFAIAFVGRFKRILNHGFDDTSDAIGTSFEYDVLESCLSVCPKDISD